MGFDPIAINDIDVGLSLLSAFIVVFGLLSLFLKERLYIGEAVWATVFGIIIGPHCAGIFNPRAWGSGSIETSNEITIQVTRIVLAVGVFAIGVELPKAYVGRHWKSLAFLLGPIMVLGWFISSGLIYALVPGLDFLSSLAVGACLTPTDPILAAAVVGGRYAEKHVPAHLRHLLACESGVNDGAAFPMLFIALYLILDKSDATAVGHWFYITWVYEIILGTVLGAMLGYVARQAMKYCERHDLIDRHSYVAQYISLALLSNGITTILGSDDLLSSFACGTAFAYDGWFNKKTEETLFSNVIDLLFNIACFVYIGAWLPFESFNDATLTLTWWRLLCIALLVIILRRLPFMLMLYTWIPEVKTFREAVFSGHFGPMGVGAIFISTLAVESIPHFDPVAEGRPPETQLELLAASMQPIVSFIVLISIAIHGLSIPFFSLGKRVHSISRTWSRHTSLDPSGAPEWADQTRRVTRADEIIINRDPVLPISQADEAEIIEKLERGELETSSPGAMTPSSPESPYAYDEKRRLAEERDIAEAHGEEIDGITERNNELERQHGGEGHIVGLERAAMNRDRLQSYHEAGDSPIPDRDQMVGDETQWREGNHLIIERKVGDGEDVEVEVIRNCFDDNETTMHKIVQGARATVKAHIERETRAVKAGMEELTRKISPQSSGHQGGTHGALQDLEANPHDSPENPPESPLRIIQAWTPISRGDLASRRSNSGGNLLEALTSSETHATRPNIVIGPSSSQGSSSNSSPGEPEESDRFRSRSAVLTSSASGSSLARAVPRVDTGVNNRSSHHRSRSASATRSLRFADAELPRRPSTAETSPTMSPTGTKSKRRHSFRRKLFGRAKLSRPDGRDDESRAEDGAEDDDEGNASDNAFDENDGDEDEGEGDGDEDDEDGRGRSSSPRAVPLDLAPERKHRHRHRHSAYRAPSSAPRSPERGTRTPGSETPRRRARFAIGGDDDDEMSGPGPSPKALHQRLNSLASSSSGSGISPSELRQNPLTSSTSIRSNPSSRSQSHSRYGSSSIPTSPTTTAMSTLSRSIRFAEDSLDRPGSSSSLSRMAGTVGSGGTSTGSGNGSGSGHSHQHLHYQHTHHEGGRRVSPAPTGSATPRHARVPSLGASLVIPGAQGERERSRGRDGGANDTSPGGNGAIEEPDREGNRGKGKAKVPLSELF